MAKRILVLGVGNTLRGDDGVGYCLARAVAACGGAEGADVKGVQMLNPGHFALLEGYSHVVFIDAYVDPEMPQESDIAVLDLDPSVLSPSDVAEIVQNTDPHGMDPIRLIVMAYAAGMYRGKGTLIGVKPEAIEFMKGLTPGTRRRAMRALEKLEEALRSLGARLKADRECVEKWLKENCTKPLLD